MKRKTAKHKPTRRPVGDSTRPDLANTTITRRPNGPVVAIVFAASIVAIVGAICLQQEDSSIDNSVVLPDFDVVALTADDEPKMREVCSHCHQFPAPDVLPRGAWRATIWEMFKNSGHGRTVKWHFDPEAVVHWYEQRAPEAFSFGGNDNENAFASHSIFSARPIGIQAPAPVPAIANIQVANVIGDERLEVIACDMLGGRILVGNLGEADCSLRSIATIPNPAHAEVVDLDGDLRNDLVIANLGSFQALDHNLGSIELLRQQADESFEHFTLADGLGRVADVEPTDFDDDGDLDLIVAEFGWHVTGHLLLLENKTVKNGTPAFIKHEIDGLHGASHVDVADLDGDGVNEIVVLYSQGHEMVKCYKHLGNLIFATHELYRAPSPAWGFSGSQIVDMDHDGDLDILLSNGDTFDNTILKPYHGIQWLENVGDFAFEPHDVGTLYGVYRAEAADLDGDGDQDIAACILITPNCAEAQQIGSKLPSLVWYEQTTPNAFVPHRLETHQFHHPTLTLADYDGDGDKDLLVGNGQLNISVTVNEPAYIEVWLNESKTRETPDEE